MARLLKYVATERARMCLALLILAIEATAATARLLPDQNPMRVRHEQWMAKYGRTYKDDAEKEYRLKIFEETVKLVESHNSAGNSTYELEVNEFADLTMEEFIATYTGELDLPMDPDIPNAMTLFKFDNETDGIRPSVDWTVQGAVTPVRNQFDCGTDHPEEGSSRSIHREARGHFDLQHAMDEEGINI